MENRKFINFLIPILLLGFLISPRGVFAYEVATHALLTKEAVKFYNKSFSNKAIDAESIMFVVDGARLEDNMPRYLNHFYDPVNNRGLDDLGFRGMASKDWVQNKDAQTAILYRVMPQTEASLLSATQINQIKPTFKQSDFTWQKAVNLYAQGDTKAAFFALGHVLHLIEDASVPDHTRNDAHPPFDDGGSPYENWTGQFNLDNPDSGLSGRLSGKKPINLADLNSYFQEMAEYSNKNFYSKDSIKNYELPEPDYFQIGTDGENYGFKKDQEFSDYYLIIGSDSLSWSDRSKLIYKGEKITQDYWHRLSVKAVQHAAGVIHLFYKEAEIAKQKYLTEKAQRPILATFMDGLRNIFGSGPTRDIADTVNDLKLSSEVDLTEEASNVEDLAVENQSASIINAIDLDSEPVPAPKLTENNPAEKPIVQNAPTTIAPLPVSPITGSIGQGEATASTCSFATNKVPTRNSLIINEVAWMGNQNSSSDEWFELKNISGKDLDISGWQAVDKLEQIKVTVTNGTKLAAGKFYLLERTDDNSVSSVVADQIYTGALSNTDEGLRLFDQNCNLMDEALASPGWPAGDVVTHNTMERKSDLTWQTSSVVSGTPKAENSSGLVQQSESQPPAPEAPVAPPAESDPLKVLISEAQITGGSGKTENDFIELFNPNNEPVNLKGYRLVRRTKTGTSDTSIKSWTDDAFIPAKGYYLWANSGYGDISVTPDVTTSATIANDNGVAIRFGAEDTGTIIDSVGWGTAQNNFVEIQPFSENPIANQSISRKSENDTNNNAVDFIKSNPTPKNSQTSGRFLSVVELSEPVTLVEPQLQSAGHLVISEIFIDMEGADTQEFVELYNPTNQAITLSEWSLQYLSGDATSTDKTVKKNFPSSVTIQPQSFYLVGIGSYSGSVLADMSWSQSLNNTAATVFLVNGTTTIDRIAYGTSTGLLLPEGLTVSLPPAGQSLERKAFYNNICTSAQVAGEFLGNGCDTDSNVGDFEIRNAPKPQNSKSLPEPRSAPAAVENFNIFYNLSNLELSLNWDATTTLIYRLSEINSASSTLLVATSTGQFSKSIKEIGKEYKFEIMAADKDGLTSSSTQASISVPSFLDTLAFYQDPRSPTTTPNYLLDLSWSNYPFVPIGDKWHTIVFYYNREAPVTDDLFWIDYSGIAPYKSWGLVAPGGFKVSYSNCIGGTTAGSALILPDTSNYCDSLAGNHASYDLNWNQLEDQHLLLPAVATNFASGTPVVDTDFVTAAFYTFQPGYEPNNYGSHLVAIDKTKYYFGASALAHQPPDMPEITEAGFGSESGVLTLSWDAVNDPDSLDSLIIYEISDGFTTATTSATSLAINVYSGESYNFSIKAKDEFGNYSASSEYAYDVPDSPLPFLSSVQWGHLQNPHSTLLTIGFDNYPFMTATATQGAIIFFLNQIAPTNYSFYDADYRDGTKLGGSNSVLQLSYDSCKFKNGGKKHVATAALIFNNADCPDTANGLFSSQRLLDAIKVGDTNATVEVTNADLGAEDFITLGFYKLGPRDGGGNAYFTRVANYNKKIYFSE